MTNIYCKAVFAFSSQRLAQIKKHNLPEFAFIGRSNVGKSSLINMLAEERVAHTSSQPGKTQLINHFIVNNKWYMVDLPGYGFAKVSKSTRESFGTMIKEYILGSENLHLLFVLLDSRLPLQKIDLDFLIFLGQNGIPFSLILTKCDKLSNNELAKSKELITNSLLEYWEELPPMFTTSSQTGLGREELLTYINELCKEINKDNSKEKCKENSQM